ncbi:hypothetical protein [Saccharibacillus sacchari]|uniref:hypothetical protein n=1 Tax=Saccharibacillus sacchari TaxID=456493 RepID=UPI0004AF632F|nr:hypothetical protein [Saccharibacillus sacchari]
MRASNETKTEKVQKNLKTILQYALLPLLVVLVLSGCSENGSAENILAQVTGNDPVQDDLLNYINEELIPLQTEESALIQKYNEKLDDPNSGDAELYDTLQSIIPDYKELIERIESIQPETPEVRELHEMYIATANKQYNAMVQMQAATEKHDMNIVSEANEKLDEARRGEREFSNALEKLSKAHNVVDDQGNSNE